MSITRLIVVAGVAMVAAAAVALPAALTASPDQQASHPAIDVATPVRAAIFPPANAAGWHNTPVTVSFSCVVPVVCPDPVVLTDNGSAQRVERTVTDANGRAWPIAVVVNIDATPGVVEIATSRVDGDEAVYTATVADDLSGIVTASCNGRPAAVAGRLVHCTVPARDGFNDLIVTTRDAAGNSASGATQAWREATSSDVEISPRRAVMRVGESLRPQFLDSAGAPVVNAWWSVVDSLVARVDQAGAIVALRPGRTDVTAAISGRMASISLTVRSPGPLPPGTQLLEMPKLPGATEGRMAVTVPTPGGAEMVSVERDGARQQVIARGITKPGESLWKELAAVAPDEHVQDWMGDAGGVLVWVEDAAKGTSAIVRIGPHDGTRLWRYDCDTSVVGHWAMSWDGTLFVQERPVHGFPYVTALDALTGRVRFRVPVPAGTPGAALTRADAPVVGPLTVPDGEGAAMTFVRSPTRETDGSVQTTIAMLRISPAGEWRVVPLTTLRAPTPGGLPDVTPAMVVPDNHNALLALLKLGFGANRTEGRYVRLHGDTRQEFALPAAGEYVTSEQLAFTSDGRTLVAFEPATGRVAWTRQPQGGRVQIVVALRGGSVLVQVGGARFVFDANGNAAPSATPPDTVYIG